ncbi:MAG: formylglycine-generating enzyme family protein [Planctomycetia bacterium]|nr:formylglycine-generating enzyme family protein [Planctomycetia bacterium]
MKKTLILLVLLMVPCLLFAAYVFMITPQGHSPSPFQNLSEEDQKYVTDGREKRAQEEIDPDLVLVSEAEGVPSEGRAAGERLVKTINGVEYAFRWCPAGEFMMGSPSGEGYDDEKPQHRVTLTQGFWMLETEVTQEMWESVMGESIETKAKQGTLDTSLAGTGSNHPMYYVSWHDCVEFCEKLSKESGLKIQLPTEAQWEYACRAGTTGAYAGKLDSMGWYRDNSGRQTHEVKTKQPNAWGLYDMHGNVWEWCLDWYDLGYYDRSPTSDPKGPDDGSYRVGRGGSWFNDAEYCRSACRSDGGPARSYNGVGFRLLFVPQF